MSLLKEGDRAEPNDPLGHREERWPRSLDPMLGREAVTGVISLCDLFGDCPLGELSFSWALQEPARELGTRLVASLGLTSGVLAPEHTKLLPPGSSSLLFLPPKKCLPQAPPAPPPRSQLTAAASRGPSYPDSSTRPPIPTMPCPVTLCHCLSSIYHLKLFICN